MAGHDIIVAGASAGGVEALGELARGLPAGLPAAVFIVHHFPAHGTSVLPAILNRSGRLKATHAQDGEPIQPGQIYVAPPDHHLLLKRGFIRVARGPRENGHRPAVDPLFRTAARVYGRRVVGVVLTGTLDDGTAGLTAVKRRGGVAVVQDPEDALYPGMPRSALENAAPDYVLPLVQIAPTLVRLAHEPVEGEEEEPVSGDMDREADIAEFELEAIEDGRRAGVPSTFTCPECHGTLWEMHEDDLIRFRCRVGHAFSADSLIDKQGEALEAALWTALRALEEKANLSHRLATRAHKCGHSRGAQQFQQNARDAEQHAEMIRQVLLNGPGESITETDAKS